ncbi:MAG TPA: hypothetical protein DDZ99_10845 [Clostridiales bacterium]|nr:hypothetical protein [Clostridiales bacterium]
MKNFSHNEFNWVLLEVIVIIPLIMLIFGIYRSIWRYARIVDYLPMMISITIGLLVINIINTFVNLFRYQPFYFMMFFFYIVYAVGIRMAYRIIFDAINLHLSMDKAYEVTPTVIIGAGQACNIILQELISPKSEYRIVGVVDDDINKISRKIRGINVYGPIANIKEICEKLNAKTIIIAMPSATKDRIQEIMQLASHSGCKVKIIPNVQKLLDDRPVTQQIRNIRIEDLLGREVTKIECECCKSFISDKVCLVTGGGGSIGSELCRQIMIFNPKKLIIVDIYENNAYDIQQELIRKYGNIETLVVRIASVRDVKKLDSIFIQYKPDVVFHAAAHKHVPLMETDPEEAVKNNIIGTYNTAYLANKYRCEKFVLISSDKAVNPTNVMGATKRFCEIILQYFTQVSEYTKYAAVRFGNVLGSNGSVIPLFTKQIENNGPVTITHPDIIRYFMTIPEAVSLVLEAAAIADGGEIYVLDMGEPVKIVDLAYNLIHLNGLEPYKDIDIKFIGLRPGEKLYEELLISNKKLEKTCNGKIFVECQEIINTDRFLLQFNELIGMAESNNSDNVVAVLEKAVDTFNHNNGKSKLTNSEASEKVIAEVLY